MNKNPDTTLNYYNDNASAYIASTKDSDIKELLDAFTRNLPQKAKVLDIGCGSGRDSKVFLEEGFEVTAIDASKELALLASIRLGQEVVVMRAQDISWQEEFDGIWAMASLLHLPKNELQSTLSKCMTSLKPGGQFFAAFKEGTGESYDEKNRFFSYYQKNELEEIFKSLEIEDFRVEMSRDVMGRSTAWLSVYAGKKLQLKHRRKNNM